MCVTWLELLLVFVYMGLSIRVVDESMVGYNGWCYCCWCLCGISVGVIELGVTDGQLVGVVVEVDEGCLLGLQVGELVGVVDGDFVGLVVGVVELGVSDGQLVGVVVGNENDIIE